MRRAELSDLSAFVADAENTLGREHSLWIARKTTA